MTSEAPELLPCPFCGGEAKVRERMDENIWDHSTVKWVSIGCSEIDCDLQGFEWPEDAEPNAVERWNTRANQQALEAPEQDWAEKADELKRAAQTVCVMLPYHSHAKYDLQLAIDLYELAAESRADLHQQALAEQEKKDDQ